jgi:hypothetical protein
MRRPLFPALIAALWLVGGWAAEAAAKPAPRGRAKAARCQPKDEFVPLKHGDGGGVWLPKEVACGGRASVILMLHGNNTDRTRNVSLGGGRSLEDTARELIDEGRVRPVILAEPVHFKACGNGLYGDAYDFAGYRVKLEKLLGARRIRVQSYSVTGHSGAGCCGGVHRAAEAFAPVKLLGLIDTCYGSLLYAQSVHDGLDGRGVIVFNAARGEPGYPYYRRFEQDLLGPHPVAIPCNSEIYRRCLKSSRRPYYSFATARADGPYHSEVPTDYYRTMLVRFFGTSRPPAPRIADEAGEPGAPPAPDDGDRPRCASAAW